MNDKPFLGRIVNWRKVECDGGLGYMIYGKSLDHPYYAGERGFHTSFVVATDGFGGIETRNSRYQLVGEETK
jgi:hypothetical protein